MSISGPGLFWSPDLVQRFPAAAGPEEAISLVGHLLVKAGAVTPEHVQAAIEREVEHPTGLPGRIPFALVHTDAPGALRLAASLGIFDQPVAFGRMDRPSEALQVRLVVMLAVPERHMQADLLSRLVTALARTNLPDDLLDLPQDVAYRRLVEQAA
jgi:PTS system galactitol-specific IIA component